MADMNVGRLLVLFCIWTGFAIGQECSIKLTDINPKTDVDINQFAGIWYISGTTTYTFGDNTWTSVTHVFYVHTDGVITFVTSGYQKNINQCTTTVIYLRKTGQSEYTGPYLWNLKVQLKVLYTDYNSAAILVCFDVQDDGTCKQHMVQFEVWSRSTNVLSTSETESLLGHVQNIDCVDFKDTRANRQGTIVKCEAPSSAERTPEIADSCIMSPIDDKGPVDRKKPSGDLHTVLVGVDSDERAHGTSYKAIPGNDEYTYYVLSSYKRGDVCSSIKVDKYKKLSENHYLQSGASVPIERWSVKLPTGGLGLFLCYKREKGRCSKSQIQFLSTHDELINLKTLVTDMEFMEKTFCTTYSFYVDQTAGFCAVPDILANIITLRNKISTNYVEKQADSETDTTRPLCRLKDIPIQESLDISKVSGLWYELVRTRSIVNNYESSVVYFHLDNANILHSTYTGSINNQCNPAIKSYTKPITDTTKCSEMEITLDGPTGTFSSHPFKIVYDDGTYAIHYGCFIQDGSGNCLQAEASIYGRQPTIDNKTKEKLYAMFPSMCLSSDDLHETAHTVDCSDWVLPDVELEHNQCQVHDIPYQNKVSLEQMVGSWYIIASRNSNGNRIDLRREGTGIVLDVIGRDNGQCKTVSTGSIVRNTHEENGDLFIAGQLGNVKPFYSMRIVYTDYKVAIMYVCWKEDINSNCNADGTIIWILSRSKTIDSVKRSILESLLKLPCGDLTNLGTVTDHCEKDKKCLVADVQAVKSLNKWKLSGIWYDIMRPGSVYDTDSGTLRLTIDNHGNIHNEFTALGANETCMQPLTSTSRQRYNKADGEFLTTPLGPYLKWGVFTLKYLYTDYDSSMVIYVCINIDVNGECAESGKRGRILSRSKTLSPDEKNKLLQYLEEACISPDDLNETNHKVDCLYRLG